MSANNLKSLYCPHCGQYGSLVPRFFSGVKCIFCPWKGASHDAYKHNLTIANRTWGQMAGRVVRHLKTIRKDNPGREQVFIVHYHIINTQAINAFKDDNLFAYRDAIRTLMTLMRDTRRAAQEKKPKP